MTQTQPSTAPAEPLWLPIFSMAFVIFNLITSEFLPVSLLTPIAHDLGVSEGTAGQMISATSIAAVVTSLLTASVTRRLNRKTVLLGAQLSGVLLAIGVAGVIGTALSSRLLTWNLRRTHILVPLVTGLLTLLLLAVGQSPLWATLVLVVWGMVESVLPVAWNNWLAIAVPDELESAGGLQVAAIQFGMTLGAALGGLIFDRGGPHNLLIGSSAALMLGAVLIWRGLNHRPTTPV